MTAETSNARGEWVMVPREVFDFLMGEGELQGAWFGETPVGERGEWFWRKHLRQAAATPPPPADAEVRARELLAAEYERSDFDPVQAQQIRDGYVNNTTATALRAIASALSQQPDARGVVDENLRRDADRWRKLMANTKSDHIWHFALSEEQKAGHDHFLDVIDALPLTGERNG